MQIKIKNKFVTEKIIDEDGNILGELKFNPNDSKIMFKLSKIANDLGGYVRKINNFGDIPEITENKLESLEEFEKASESFNKIYEAFELEDAAITNAIEDLASIFGKETIDIFTGGTKDISALLPLLDFIMPYIKEAREEKVSKYIKNGKVNLSTDVME